MNKSVMKCCICNNENIGQFITINNKKYHLCCIEQLQQENKKLNGTIQTYDILLKTNVEENKQLKEQLLVAQTNEETFRLEMEDITQTLGLDEDTLFDDVKAYARSLKDNWNKLKKYIKETKLKEFEKSCGKRYGKTFTQAEIIICNMILDKMQELERGCDSNEKPL